MNYQYSQKYFIGYSDIDRFDRCKISKISDILQNTATMHSKTVGFGTKEMMEIELAWLLLAWKIKVIKYPEADTYVEVRTWNKSRKGFRADRQYEIINENGELLVIADSEWVLYDLKNQRPTMIPQEMLDVYDEFDRDVFEIPAGKIRYEGIENGKISEVKVMKRDIDTNGHTNNSKYFDFLMEVLPDEKQINEIELNYKKQTYYGETLELEYNDEICTMKNESGEICAVAKYR